VAQDDLEKAVIRAPISGVVQLRSVTEGQYLTPGTVVAMMIQTDPLRLSFTVPESKAAQLSKDMDANFKVPAYADRRFSANVYQIASMADPQTREVQCWARVPNADGVLRAGYFADVRLAAQSNNAAVVVPLASVLPTEYGNVAYVVQDGIA